ncbi:hypothetical protein [Salinimicrobium sediminilitoris]|uniref:hypothetical protein n=1 Tax=Salinimicrobium sediminilitoris TaxID=2876715 RepID=UPI001E39941C|nr:hypothetical protein [Salinimicrobium sediminilitoris]MCC8358914.1 hypothetical protein [Salinimicrobium sediminilitoris]
MGKLRIHRSNQWYGGVRDYKIFLDNQKIGEVGKGDIKEFNIPDGEHQLFAKIDWFETKKISLNLEKDEEREIVLKSSDKSKWTIPVIFILPGLVYLTDLKLELLLLLCIPIVLLLLYTLTYGKRSFIKVE